MACAPTLAVRIVTAYLLENASSSAGNPRGCLLARGTAELAGRDADVADRSKDAFHELGLANSAAIEAAQRAGDIDPAANSRTLGDLLLAIHRGTEALGRAGADETSLRLLVEAALAGLPRPAKR
jgi:TetR/AcrR family transcriptional repressor of nem operon